MIAPMTKEMIVDILGHERFPVRFEDFCTAMFFAVDGKKYVTTSTTWDHGRDARGVSTKSEQPPFICCSIEHDVVAKAIKDTKRICEDVIPTSLLFCYNDVEFTEHKSIEIEKEVRALVPTLEVVRSYGADQLAQLTMDHPGVFEHYYQGELTNLRDALATPSISDGNVALTGLRIALTTQLTEDAETRRKDLVQNLVLTALASGASATINEIAVYVSEQLHLVRSVNAGWLQAAVNDLVHTGLIVTEHGAYRIAQPGIEDVKRRTAVGSKLIMDGQGHVHDLIEELTGHKLGNQEWQRIWKILQDHITAMFLSHGITIVESIESVISGKTAPTDHDDLCTQISRISAALNPTPGQGVKYQEIAQAISDMFLEKQSPAFQWLASLCEVYVHVCALGLEPKAQHQILTHLRDIDLLPDTDVVISFLSTGDANHSVIENIIEGWKGVGGQLMACEPVLEETAHHAWISENDYEMTWRLFPKLTVEQAQHEIENAFVRGYWTEVFKGHQAFSNRSWNYYISAFRGDSHLEFGRIEELLDDHGIEILPDASEDATIAKWVSDFLFQTRKGAVGSNASAINDLQEKCARDGRLIAILMRQRKAAQHLRRNVFVVSTSLALRRTEAILPELKETTPVLSVAAVAWLLSLAPGVRMSADSLRGVLFDVDFPRHLSPLERVTLRILEATEEYRFHFSRRATLKRAVREKLVQIATEEGVAEAEVTSRFLSNDRDSDSLKAEVIATAIDSMSRSKSEKEIIALQQKIQNLEETLAKERAKHRSSE